MAGAFGLAAASLAQAGHAEGLATVSAVGVDDGAPLVVAQNAAAVTAAAEAADPPAAAPAKHIDNPMDHLGTGVFERFISYNKLEWGQPGPPADPNAPPSRRADFPPQPVASPPFPFTEWPYGGATSLAVNRTASYDSPLDVAIANTWLGKAMTSSGIQAYGWVDYGGNVSTSSVRGGNAPAAYLYNPNSITLDQAVIYVERTPDTVQTDHIDWGFRLSGIYGTNYRYTTSYGLASYQLLKYNKPMGYDFPMLWLELYVPKVFDGLFIRVGRYISVPDIEAQLAPNNYMYTHSITYTFDNYTNEGLQTTWLLNKNWMFQLSLNAGTEATLGHIGATEINFDPNPLFPGKTFRKDPGAQPSVTSCLRWESNTAKDTAYVCLDAHNKGNWGYNNLQWQGFTYYHKWNDAWHTSFEFYNEFQLGVINLNNPAGLAAYNNGGTPFSPQYMPFNAPSGAYCKSRTVFSCRTQSMGAVQYTAWQFGPLDDVSLRTEVYDDEEGQRTGTAATYEDVGIGWQHWLSPQIELRPEFTYYWATHDAFNGNSNHGIAPDKKHQAIVAADAILHF